MIIVEFKPLRSFGILAMMLWPVLLVADKKRFYSRPAYLRHEKIHARQQLEMLIVFFYLWYAIEWIIRRISSPRAYYLLSFEKEAYQNENDPYYLHNRPALAFMDYL